MPARQGKPAPQQPKDAYAASGKTLASQVQRLRGWLSTDASRLPELVDALNALVAHRLEGHAYGAAGADAQEAVKRSADQLLGSGPVGPYSSAADAVRCGTALVQLAALQVAVGLVDPAGATLDSWEGIRLQVAEAGTAVELAPEVGRHALTVAARVALAAGDVSSANAYADAASAVAGPPPAEAGFGTVDLNRLASDARWAAGLAEQSLGFLHLAKESYEQSVGDRLADPARLAPALAERLTEPMPGLYRDLADRLGAVGELDLALANRRLLVARLHAYARRSETFVPPLVAALTDLASDLLRAERVEEAFDAATEAQEAAAGRVVLAAPRLLAEAVLARASLATGRPAPAGPLRGVLAAEGEAAGPAARSVVLAALAETLRAEGLEDAAGTAYAQATEATGAVLEDVARGVVSRGDGSVSWAPLDPQRAYGAPLQVTGGPATAVPTWLEQERAEAHREEQERAEVARREAEDRAAEEARVQQAARAAAAARAASEAQEAEREEARRQAAEEAEQAERKRRREERLREHQAEVDAREREQRAVRRDEIDARLAELDAAEEPERERLLAERASFDEADAPVVIPEPVASPEPVEPPQPEPVEPPQPQPEPEPEPEPRPESEPQPDEPQPDEPLIEPEPPAPEPAEPEPEPDDLELADQALTQARANGGRREVRAALEAVVDVLRSRHTDDPAAYAVRLRSALEELSSARLRGGDLFGARAASREAKSLR